MLVHAPAQLRQAQRDQLQHHDLGDERLGRRDRDLGTGLQVAHRVGVARQALPTTLVTTTIAAPRSSASLVGASVSAVSPDWLTLMTSVRSSMGGGE